MNRHQLRPDTTLYPVPVVLITCGEGESANVFTINRIASCNADPPMISISVRPGRLSHERIENSGEFVVSLPWPEDEALTDFVGSTTARDIDKWAETGLVRLPAAHVGAPLLADCPVNLECRVNRQVSLPSHTLFIADVLAVHAVREVLNEAGEVDLSLAREGMRYGAAVVRERPVQNFSPESLLEDLRRWRRSHK